MAVCRFNGLTLTVMEAQLNLLCSNTMCRPEECLAKLRSQAALQNYFFIFSLQARAGQLDAILPVQHGKLCLCRWPLDLGKRM